jgi:type IV secretory pathway VirB2 component (pilin)
MGGTFGKKGACMHCFYHHHILNKALFLGILSFILLHADTSYAAGGALFDSGTNFLSALQNLLTSTWARIIAIIGVVFLGFAWMFGRISMHLALSVIGGIILVFGAPAIVDSISASL